MESSLNAFPTEQDANVHETWDYHTYISYTDPLGFDHLYDYGAPANITEYCLRVKIKFLFFANPNFFFLFSIEKYPNIINYTYEYILFSSAFFVLVDLVVK